MKFRASQVQLVIVLAATAMLVSCGTPAVTADALAKRPEGHLFYPGSQLINTSRQDEHPSEGGTYMGMLTQALSASASPDQIYSWYLTELQARGWTLRKTERVNGSYDLFTRGDRELFQVGADPASATYQTRFAIVPVPCATDPPTRLAFANCG